MKVLPLHLHFVSLRGERDILGADDKFRLFRHRDLKPFTSNHHGHHIAIDHLDRATHRVAARRSRTTTLLKHVTDTSGYDSGDTPVGQHHHLSSSRGLAKAIERHVAAHELLRLEHLTAGRAGDLDRGTRRRQRCPHDILELEHEQTRGDLGDRALAMLFGKCRHLGWAGLISLLGQRWCRHGHHRQCRYHRCGP